MLASSRSDGRLSPIQGFGLRPMMRPNVTHPACPTEHDLTQLNKDC